MIDQVPVGGGMNKPASGTYGEKAPLERLEAQLPDAGDPQAAGQAPLPPMGQTPPLPPPAAGLPRSIFEPSRQPGVPAGAPMAPDAPPPPSTPSETVIRTMQMLAENKDRSVSRTTQTFAQNFLAALGR